MKNLIDRVVLITGASSGIGRELAIRCANLNATKIILAARRIEKLKEIENKFPEKNIISLKADLSTIEGINDFLNNIEPYAKEITDVFNNAGFGWYGFYKDMQNKDIENMINVNILAVSLITKFFINLHSKNQSAKFLHIFNIGSIAGFFPVQGIPLYSASKSFIDSFTKSLQSEYAKEKSIFFTLVLPGAIRTEFFEVAQKLDGAQKIKINLFEITTEKATDYLIKGLFKRKKVIYIPSIMTIIPLVGFLFGKIIRSLGPVLLKDGKNS